mgnify:CR=1 FL=1
MTIDYKFNSITRDGINTIINISIYKGDFQNITTFDIVSGQDKAVSRYIRTQKLLIRQYSRPGTFTDNQIRIYVNNRLKEIRDANYPTLTFLGEQEVYV